MVDEDTLLAAVRSGQVMSAGLDSFAVEPLAADNVFKGQPGFVLSPHIGGVTGDACVNMGVAAARNVRSVVEGASPPPPSRDDFRGTVQTRRSGRRH